MEEDARGEKHDNGQLKESSKAFENEGEQQDTEE